MATTAIFAGGCFWCLHGEFSGVPGVSKVVSGYTGGHVSNPTYEQICTGRTGHVEAIEVTYDPKQVNYQQLLDIFWRNIDPLDDYGQFCDKGPQYRSGIFVLNEEQETLAKSSLETVKAQFGRPLATFIEPASPFYPAEDYHQDYYIKSQERYKRYKQHSGREERLRELWK